MTVERLLIINTPEQKKFIDQKELLNLRGNNIVLTPIIAPLHR